MKTFIKILILSAVSSSIDSVDAQTINWAGLNDGNKHVISASLGFDYGIVYGLGYYRKFNKGLFPFVANVRYSSPAGNNVFDDFRIETGAHIRWFKLRNFQFSTKVNGVFRRYENSFVNLVNFGSDLSGVLGYYKPRWSVSGEAGFDKAIVTSFRHSAYYLEINPAAANGWFVPSTGGNFYYGLQTGVSLSKSEINLRIGKILSQDFKTRPTFPYYFQLIYSRKF